MNIGLNDIYIKLVFLLYCGLVWFDSVGKIKTANQTKPCDWVKKWSEYIRTKCGFGLDWSNLQELTHRKNEKHRH